MFMEREDMKYLSGEWVYWGKDQDCLALLCAPFRYMGINLKQICLACLCELCMWACSTFCCGAQSQSKQIIGLGCCSMSTREGKGLGCCVIILDCRIWTDKERRASGPWIVKNWYGHWLRILMRSQNYWNGYSR